MKSKDEKKILEEIDDKLENFDINKIQSSENKPSSNLVNPNNSRLKSYSTIYSASSANNTSLVKSYESVPFEEKIDLDLPNYTSTKYNSKIWKDINCLFYSLFCSAYIINIALFILKKYYIYPKLVSDISFLGYNSMNWFHYKRGCIGYSNLNSKFKTNRDKSLKAKLLRSEYGLKYFFVLIANSILIYSDFYFIGFCEEQNPDFWNIRFVGLLIISLCQIFKIEKILTDNRHYDVKNDLSNCFVEIFLFFGTLIISTSYLIQMMYFHKQETFIIFIISLKCLGIFFIILSNISLIYRFYFSGFQDLNASQNSNLTIY